MRDAAGLRRPPARRSHDLTACAVCISVVWTLVILLFAELLLQQYFARNRG